MKRCTVCDIEKELECFSFQKKGKFGVTSVCKPCTSERGKKWHINNREKSLSNKSAYYEANKKSILERRKAWTKANADRCKLVAAKWSANNKDKKRSATARRRAIFLRSIPSWARMDDIARFYALAERLTLQTGIKANVDHLVPLQSHLVCGLHCAANLSVISEANNKSKGNLWWPDMPGGQP